jgi:hypothetical protein
MGVTAHSRRTAAYVWRARLWLRIGPPFCSFVLPLKVLLKRVQRFFAKHVRVSLTCFGKLDDLVGDDFVSNRVVIDLDSSISKRGANQLIR